MALFELVLKSLLTEWKAATVCWPNVCSPQVSPSFTKHFSCWPRKALPKNIPRPSWEKGCSSNSWIPCRVSLSTAAMLQKGGRDAWPCRSSNSGILPSVPGAPWCVIQVYSSLISLFLKCSFLGTFSVFSFSHYHSPTPSHHLSFLLSYCAERSLVATNTLSPLLPWL